MRLSKHHYAIELVKRGNTVYYIETPENKNRAVSIEKVDGFEKLLIVKSGLKRIRNRHIRIKLPALFDHLVKKNTKKIQNAIDVHPDIVWSFDLNGFFSMSIFSDAIKIAQPVDFVAKFNYRRAQEVDFVFSVAEEILEPLKQFCKKTYFINHGVSRDLIDSLTQSNLKEEVTKIKVGYVGNLLRNDINHSIIEKLVKNNPNCDFIFMGNYKASNISAKIDESSIKFIEVISSFENAKLLGVLNTHELAKAMSDVDIFLICYDEEKDMCKGTNYHKVLEYIATGNVLVSNHISTYAGLDLFEMTDKGYTDDEFEVLFKKVLSNINTFNSKELREKRKNYALEHLYSNQIEKIDRLLEA